ncbi:hypothetical protein ACFOLC_08585 [Lysobacter cavernae]|uniref:Energy transducer TonB n=1 Tax=Lysobacter cavernae TaxID=1685901 RepID=A0ABV7RSY3_9GAMM
MNIKRERSAAKKSRLENEVILAVVILYLLLSGALLAIHFAMPSGTETVTSSTSPSHGEPVRKAPAAPNAKTAADTTAADKNKN